MDVAAIPFNRLIGLRHSESEGSLLELEARPEHADHLGTVHASAQLSLAEATAAALLAERFDDLADRTVPVVRRLEAEFHRPAAGLLRGRAKLTPEDERSFVERLNTRGRASVTIAVEVVDADGQPTLSAGVEWFAQKGDLIA